MSLEHFQLIDNEPVDNSIIKRDYTKVYHQQGANLKDSNQNVDFIVGENNIYHQIRKAYLEFDISVRNPAANFTDASVNRLVNKAFAYCFKQAALATMVGMDLEEIKYVGQVSTIMSLLTPKGSDLSSCFDINGEKALDINNPLKQILINNHSVEVKKGKIKAHLPLEHIFGSCKTFKKITKKIGFHLTFKMDVLQDIFFTTIATDVNVMINSLY